LQGERVLEELGPCVAAALDGVAAEFVDGLRREAEVAHDGDSDVDHAADVGDEGGAALEFDSVGAGLLEEACSGADGVFDAGAVGAEGHVGDDVGPLGSADDGSGVIDHLVEGDGDGGAVSLDDAAERVSNEDGIDAGFVDEAGEGGVVGGDDGDGLLLLVA
jgi:hypothetical protein